jgi:hypothetical protein
MSNDDAQHGGLWRLLVLDRDPADPVWLIATVETPADVQPAHLAAADQVGPVHPVRPAHLIRPGGETGQWVATASGLVRPVFTAMSYAGAWRIDEGSQP